MSDHHTYKKIEVVGSSRDSIDDAIRNAIKQSAKSVNNLEWFEVVETRGHIVDGDIGHFQVVLKLGFKIESS
ncbi:dodecin domain-containing protein [Seongchinamella sediminis]|uniref:Dodecin domain-containing protein n=1 Tax=Seongchinamella sediminis TaxID=2283635 RepID=A0A3L7DX67_9GAMM|nr:dodecin [Seongchinamella sediminis]RLQ21375.1 dodecin domain-containing protein [Seongchinamella sediminis]